MNIDTTIHFVTKKSSVDSVFITINSIHFSFFIYYKAFSNRAFRFFCDKFLQFRRNGFSVIYINFPVFLIIMIRLVNSFFFATRSNYIIIDRIVNLKLLNSLLLSLYRRLIARCCLSRLTASVSGCCCPVGLIYKTVLLTVCFKLLFLLLEFISRLVKTLFVAESVKAGA